MLAPAITPANAREMQQRAVLARKRNAELARQQAQVAPEQPASPAIDPYVNNLAHAQVYYLEKLMEPDITAKDAAALSQALKNLRETYHMASGQPKPGTIKPVSQRPRQQSRDLPDGPDSGQ